MSDLNSLPVPPEFVESLQETALKTALDCLERLDLPQEVVALVKGINDLSFYVAECYRNPDTLVRDRNDRFDIEGVVIGSIDAIARAGGVFQGAFTTSAPRKINQPIKK